VRLTHQDIYCTVYLERVLDISAVVQLWASTSASNLVLQNAVASARILKFAPLSNPSLSNKLRAPPEVHG
jgi:hypothetical protein